MLLTQHAIARWTGSRDDTTSIVPATASISKSLKKGRREATGTYWHAVYIYVVACLSL